MALLMPEGERATREGLSWDLSDYYNSPGRFAAFRRKFESATRQEGEDPATFATELEILAVRGFGDMGQQARKRMVWDRFISDQQNCGLRRHSVPPDTPIREIVDRCRVWKSHSEQKRGPPPRTNALRGHMMVASDSRESLFFTEDSPKSVVTLAVEPQTMLSVALVVGDGNAGVRKALAEIFEEGASGCWSAMATAPIASGSVDTKPRIGGGGAGVGVFLVWSVGTWDQPMLPGGHCLSVFTAGMVGGFM